MEAKIVSVTKLKPQILKVISMAQEAGQEYVVTKNGHPAAVIMSYEEWESWKETVEILSDPKALARIRKNAAYFNRGGKGKTLEQIFDKAA
ncbi:MAG: type II toxin-antitoxin system Phd/YefM family antitoxin [Candidatus Omnitrophica bacterium]|nr:type II toxin-antitoxin system Phd/YefM family antitoxin [Candidatus Omnitrophota bacterium]